MKLNCEKIRSHQFMYFTNIFFHKILDDQTRVVIQNVSHDDYINANFVNVSELIIIYIIVT